MIRSRELDQSAIPVETPHDGSLFLVEGNHLTRFDQVDNHSLLISWKTSVTHKGPVRTQKTTILKREKLTTNKL